MCCYVECFEGVEICMSVCVMDVFVECKVGVVVVKGVLVFDVQGFEEMILSDVFIDVCGCGIFFLQWFEVYDVVCENDEEDVEIFYFIWYYWLFDGCDELFCGCMLLNGDFIFLKFGVFFGDNGCFFIIFVFFVCEVMLWCGVMCFDGFDCICVMFFGVVFWIVMERVELMLKVWGMGVLYFQWCWYCDGESFLIFGFFVIGDVVICINFFYGCGCLFGVVQGYVFVQIFVDEVDLVCCSLCFEEEFEGLICEFFDDMWC